MSAPVCSSCGTVFEGTRSQARRAKWEPNSWANQWAIDEGPMTCPTCILQLLDNLLDAMRSYDQTEAKP